MKAILTSIFLLTIIISFAQVNDNDFILTFEQNTKWIEAVKTKDLSEKLANISQRIIADTDIYYYNEISHFKTGIKEGYKEKSTFRPLYIFLCEGREQFHLSGNPKKKAILKLSEFLVSSNISKVKISNEIEITAIYGSRASSGVIFITIKDMNTFDLIRNLII